MSADGTVELLVAMDFIVFPVMNGSWVMRAVQQFIETMNQHIITTGKSRIKSMHLLRNMVNSWEVAALSTTCKAVAENTGVSLMDAILPYSRNFRKDVFHTTGSEVCVSTVFPFDERFLVMLNEFMAEMEQIIKESCGKS